MRWGKIAASVSCLAFVAACGGDDESGDETTTTEAAAESTTTEGSEESTTTTEGGEQASGSDELCDAYQQVADATADFQEEFNAILQPLIFGDEETVEAEGDEALEALRAHIAEATPPMLAAYDDLAGVIDDDLSDEVESVRAYTESISEAIAGAPDFESVVAEIFAAAQDPVALESGEANEALAADADEACGITLIV